MRWQIAVIGAGAGATTEECATAAEVGRLLADAGCVIVNGGLGGVMAAAAEGAAETGGTSIGLLPGTDRTSAAEALTIAIPTGLGEIRNALVIRAADGVIAVGGSWGTLSEIALAMRTDKPLVVIGGWHVTNSGGAEMAIPRAGSAADAVATMLDVLGG
jgi:hypothetical protein